MIKVLLVDDEKLIREGLKILLSEFEDIEIIGDCADGLEATKFCRDNDVDVVLMDIRMGKYDGVMGTRMVNELKKNIKILILTTFKDDEYIFNAMNYGASGYLLKDSSAERIYDAIKSAHSGNIVVHPEVADRILSNKEPEIEIEKIKDNFKITDREIEIVKLISKGLTNKEISEQLFLTEGTVKNNITRILSKLDLRDRTQIVIFAYKNNLAD